MPFCKITFTPLGVPKSSRGLFVRRQFTIFILKRFPLTLWKTPKEERRALSSSRIKMSSDDSYAAFLKKSQKDYSQPPEGAPKGAAAPATTASTTAKPEVHPAVKALGERYYVSDADEPFEGVSFDWQKETLPDQGLRFFLVFIGLRFDCVCLDPDLH